MTTILLVQFQCMRDGDLFYFQHRGRFARALVRCCPVCKSVRIRATGRTFAPVVENAPMPVAEKMPIERVIYTSKNGSDVTATGTREAPFFTLKEAMNAAKRCGAGKTRPFAIRDVDTGAYPFPEPIHFDPKKRTRIR